MSAEPGSSQYKALAERIDEYLQRLEALHISIEPSSFLGDLRTVVTMLNEAAEAKPVAWIAPSTPAPDGADYRAIQQDYDISGGYGCSAYTAQSRGWLPLFTHPAPQPKRPYGTATMSEMGIVPMCDDPNMIAAEDRFPDEPRGIGDYGAAIPGIERPCTCHPDDNPPVPCAQKYALNECRAAAQPKSTVSFDDASVQRVYGILCSEDVPLMTSTGRDSWLAAS